jgi:titin
LDTIAFNINGGGAQTISPISALPAITDPVIIDGTTQPGFAGMPLIVLNGTMAGAHAYGLTISAGSSTVRGLVINTFAGIGVLLQTKGGNVIQGDYIGTDATGTMAQGNGMGIDIATGTNQIGGTTAGVGNVISGNTGNGITIFGTGTAGNGVQGNFIGTDLTGTVALGNGGSGVAIVGPGNTIGGTLAGAGNVISGNKAVGIAIYGNGTTSNLVQGNFIGADLTGTKALGNGASGVSIFNGATNNTIGGTSGAARNLISANAREGVTIWVTSQNVVQGNFIGTDLTGTKALGNASVGVSLFGAATNNTIGGIAAGAGNLISANNGGLAIYGKGTMNNLVQGNFIGTDSTGTTALGNKGIGAAIASGATGNTIGGTAPGARNLISGNSGSGLVIFGATSQNVVEGNFIGTDVTGANPLGNSANGIMIKTSNNNLIGGTTPGAGNTIAFNGNDGVLVDTGTGNGIRGNSIFGHAGLGIQLVNNGNNNQPYPNLKVVHSNDSDDNDDEGDGKVTVMGTLNSTPNSQFTIEWFVNNSCNPSGFGEGEKFIGSMIVTTNALGRAKFTMTFTTGVSSGQFISATATDANNNTSQFSRCVRIGPGESDDSESDDQEETNVSSSPSNVEGRDIVRPLSQQLNEVPMVGFLSTGDNSLAHPVKLLEIVSGQELFTMGRHTKDITSLSVIPNAKELASASKDGTVKIWDANEK